MSLLRVTVVSSPYQVREKRLYYIVASNALGIGAASFASHAGTGTGIGNKTEFWERGGDGASKDIAESPTASPERPH